MTTWRATAGHGATSQRALEQRRAARLYVRSIFPMASGCIIGGIRFSTTNLKFVDTFDTTTINDGGYTLWANATNTTGAFNLTSISVTIDNYNPVGSLNTPPDFTSFCGTNVCGYTDVTNVRANVTATDANLDSVWGCWIGTATYGNYTFIRSGTTNHYYNDTTLAPDTYTFCWWANDTAGHTISGCRADVQIDLRGMTIEQNATLYSLLGLGGGGTTAAAEPNIIIGIFFMAGLWFLLAWIFSRDKNRLTAYFSAALFIIFMAFGIYQMVLGVGTIYMVWNNTTPYNQTGMAIPTTMVFLSSWLVVIFIIAILFSLFFWGLDLYKMKGERK